MDKIVRLTHINIGKLSNFVTTISIFTFLLLIISCSKNDEVFKIGSQFLESESNIRRVDTFSVELSTVIIDSFPTNAFNIALVGVHWDEIFGKVTCSSFFELGTAFAVDIMDEDIYDGVEFILPNTDYSYGDTTQELTLRIHPLISELTKDSRGFINNSRYTAYDASKTIGSITYKPMPNTYDSVSIPISDEIGLQLYNMLKNNSDTILSNDNFKFYYLKGIALVADTNTAKSIINFNAGDGQIKLRIRSHRVGAMGDVKVVQDFPLINSAVQYNKIAHDFSGSDAAKIQKQRKAVHSSETNNSSFLYGGVGMMTRVRFPTMPDMLLIKNSFVVYAELVLYPKVGSYTNYALPTEIMMYSTDESNHLENIFYNSDGTTINTAAFAKDPYSVTYTFNLTNYIITELADSHFDIHNGLLISNLPEKFIKSFERLVFEASDPAPVLKLYYVTY